MPEQNNQTVDWEGLHRMLDEAFGADIDREKMIRFSHGDYSVEEKAQELIEAEVYRRKGIKPSI